jgi:hypothetical protein
MHLEKYSPIARAAQKMPCCDLITMANSLQTARQAEVHGESLWYGKEGDSQADIPAASVANGPKNCREGVTGIPSAKAGPRLLRAAQTLSNHHNR